MQTTKPPIEGIESGLEKVESKTEPDAADKLEDASVDKMAAETKVLLENVKDKIDIRGLRRLFSRRLYVLAIGYLIYVGCLTLLQGFHILGFSLEGMVLVALIGAPPLLGYVVKIISSASK
jgi:hypothetical protein